MTDRLTPYAYWRIHREPGHLAFYDGDTELRPFLRKWLRLQWWRLGFWFAHKVERQPLPPVPERVLSGETTTTTLDEIVRGWIGDLATRTAAEQPNPWLSRLPLKPKDEP